MYEPAGIFRSLLLCGIVYTIANSIQIANALNATYEIGGVTRTGEFIPNHAGANGSKAVYAPSSAAKMPNGTRIPYGLRGTLRTGSKFFKQLMLAEAGLEVIDWVASQYNLQSGQEITSTEIAPYLMLKTEVMAANYVSQMAFSNTCNPSQSFNTLFAAAEDLQTCVLSSEKVQNACNGSGYCTTNGISFNQSRASLTVNFFNQNGQYWGGATGNTIVRGQEISLIGNQKFYKLSTLGEPTIAPNPWRTGEIIEAYAGKVGGWGDFVSPNVQILDQPIRWTELPAPEGMPTVDTVTDLIRVPGYEPKPPALIPDPEPLRPDPDGLKKIPNPLLQGLPDPTTPNPPPAVRTNDLIGGGMTVTNTYNIQNTSTAVNLNIENKEITYAGNEEEIKPPADLTEAETLEAKQRLLVPKTDKNLMDSYVQDILSKVPVPQVELLSDNSATCPPPRRLALFGTTEIELSYDGICKVLPMVKAIMLGFIGFALFGVWLKRISSS